MRRKAPMVFLCIVITFCSIVLRTYNYKHISFDYDEDATITQVENTSLQRIYNYIFLQNVFKYEEISQIERGSFWHVNIWFPLFYIPLKIASIFRHDIDFLRLVVIIFGILIPVFLFLLGNKYSLQTGIIASVLFLFHPWAHFHSTYIRFYGFWALISTVCLWYVESILTKIQRGRTTFGYWITLAVCILLPSTVHAFGVISSFFLLCMLISHFYYHRTDFTNISLAHRSIFGVTFISLAIIIGTNVLLFAHAAFIEFSSYSSTNESLFARQLAKQSTVHVFASTLFNFGYFYPIILVLLLFFMFRKKSHTSIILTRYVFSMAISFIPILFIMLKAPQSIRPDYIYGIFPWLLLVTALSIEYIAQELTQIRYKMMFSVTMTLFLIASTLPTFISNVFIDYDRFDYQEAARFISTIENANLYSTAPGHFNLYSDEHRVQQLAEIDPETCHAQKDEYFLIRMRKGKSTLFFYDFNRLKDAQLVEIIGKDRIDLRANKIYVFFRNCIDR